MTITELLKLINQASWPAEVVLAPQDFFALSTVIPLHYDDGTPYFYVAATKVRAKNPREDTLFLGDWLPPRISVVDRIIEVSR